jgi:elongation factor 2
LRITDGALIVVDCIEGVCVQTETLTCQALGEQIKPVLHVNKVDRVISELQLDPEELYQMLDKIIGSVNIMILKHGNENFGDLTVDPCRGSVSFGSGKQGWAFTLPMVAQKLSERTGRPPERILKYLWGDYFYDPAQKRCVRSSVSPKTGEKLTRYICQVLFKPLFSIYQTVKDENYDHFFGKILPAIHVDLTDSEKSTLRGNSLISRVLHLWMPAGDALVTMVIDHVPSPVQAQKYRAENLYTGPADDEVARAIQNCDPEGPLTVFISKMVPITASDRFFAFGRVFSGTARPDSEVYIMNHDHVPGSSKYLPRKKLKRLVSMMGRYTEDVEVVPCGCTLGIFGIDPFLMKSGTLSAVPDGYPIVPLKISAAPVFCRTLSVDNSADVPEFLKGLKRISDPLLRVTRISPDKFTIEGAGELHLEVALADLRSFLGGKIGFTISDPIVGFRETISANSESVAVVKSPNKHNQLWFTAEPLGEELCVVLQAEEEGTRLSVTLVSKFGWTEEDAGRIWSFVGTNCLVDQTHGVQFLREIREHVIAAFESVVKEGMLCGEPMSGVRFNLADAALHPTAIHRGASQIVPTARHGFYTAFWNSVPTLLEPVYLVEIVTDSVAPKIYPLVTQLRGHVIDEHPKEGTPLWIVNVHLPVLESFSFTAALREATGGRAFPHMVFDHWQPVAGDPRDPDSEAGGLVKRIRERKGMPPDVPDVS